MTLPPPFMKPRREVGETEEQYKIKYREAYEKYLKIHRGFGLIDTVILVLFGIAFVFLAIVTALLIVKFP